MANQLAAQAWAEIMGRYAGMADQVDRTLSDLRVGTSRFHVDQATGDDATGTGSTVRPFKTLQKAIDAVPYATRGEIRIRGTYTTTQRYVALGKYLRIIGVDADWQPTPIDLNLSTSVVSAQLQTNGFRGVYGSSLNFEHIHFHAKTAAQVAIDHPGVPLNSVRSAIFAREFSSDEMAGSVYLRYSEIDITDDPYCTILSPSVWLFDTHTLVETHPIAGRWIWGVTAGTPASDVRNLLTNIATL